MYGIHKTQQEMLNQLPGLVCCLDNENRLIFCSDYTAKIFGYKQANQSLGVALKNLPCKVAEYSEVFAGQNRIVKSGVSLKLLDIHPFVNDEIIAFLTTKSLFKYGDDQNGVLCVGTQVSRSLLLKINSAIIQPDKKFRTGASSQRSYKYDQYFDGIKLSTRELECLFYLVRGKTVSDISNLLLLSKRTIESYIDNIKYKTGCQTKADLIEKAIDSHFVDFIPESILHKKHTQLSIIISEEKNK